MGAEGNQRVKLEGPSWEQGDPAPSLALYSQGEFLSLLRPQSSFLHDEGLGRIVFSHLKKYGLVLALGSRRRGCESEVFNLSEAQCSKP